MNLEAIHRNFWKDVRIETALARIDQLARAGYLERENTDIRGRQETVYFLGRKALAEFSETERKAFYRKAPTSTEIKHVLLMGDVLDKFKSRVVGFTNEHQLKARKALSTNARDLEVPDGYVRLESAAGQTFSFYIEIDGAYHGARLKQKVAELGKANAPVVWVAFSHGRLDTIVEAAASFANIKPVLYENLNQI